MQTIMLRWDDPKFHNAGKADFFLFLTYLAEIYFRNLFLRPPFPREIKI